jgi:hypothetical protein
MLLRHTASTLALAATLALNGATTPLRASIHDSLPTRTTTATTDVGAGSPATTCLTCVAAGVVTLASGGWIGLWTTYMIGGTAAVAGGGAVVTCTAACIAYLAED